jgi:hypothetical protein
VLDITTDKRKDKDKQNKKITTHYVLDIATHRRKDKDKQNKKSQHIMCWTPAHIRQKRKTNKTKNHNTICGGRHHAQDQRRRQAK